MQSTAPSKYGAFGPRSTIGIVYSAPSATAAAIWCPGARAFGRGQNASSAATAGSATPLATSAVRTHSSAPR